CHRARRQGSRSLRSRTRIEGGRGEARRHGKGGPAQAHPVCRPRADVSQGRPGARALRQGHRRAGHARQDPGNQVKAVLHGLHRLLSGLLVVTVAILVVPVTLQVVSRYTELVPAYIWTEELARFLFIWMVMLGAMIGVREGTHFEVDVWPS